MRSLRRVAVAAGRAAVAGAGTMHLVVVPIAYVSAIDVMLGHTAGSWTPGDFLAIFAMLCGLLLTSWGLLRASLVIAGQVAASWRLHRWVLRQRRPISARLATAVRRSWVRARVLELDADEPFAFTYGLVRPTIVVSRTLLTVVSDDELVAVLRHERHHAESRDPLALSVARVLAEGYYYVSILRHLQELMRRRQELAADRAALQACGRAALAGAMYRVVAWPEARWYPAIAAMAVSELFDDRVTQLESGTALGQPLLPRRSHLFRAVMGVGLLAFWVFGLPNCAIVTPCLMH